MDDFTRWVCYQVVWPKYKFQLAGWFRYKSVLSIDPSQRSLRIFQDQTGFYLRCLVDLLLFREDKNRKVEIGPYPHTTCNLRLRIWYCNPHPDTNSTNRNPEAKGEREKHTHKEREWGEEDDSDISLFNTARILFRYDHECLPKSAVSDRTTHILEENILSSFSSSFPFSNSVGPH